MGASVACNRLAARSKVHAICATGANLEEDVYVLMAVEEYEIIANWRALTAGDELDL